MRTVVGMVITRDGFARRSYLHQPEPERIGVSLAYRRRPAELRHRAFAIDAAEVRSVQREWLPLTLGHDPDRTVGHVEHLERAHDGSLWLVGAVHGATPEEALYLSPEWTERHDGTDLILDGVALTPRPAQILMEPVTFFEGELRDRRGWRVPERLAGMVEWAAAASRGRGWSEPLVVEDRARPVEEYSRPAGPIEHSPWAGRILSVR